MASAASYAIALQLDARGLSCPMPIIRARKAMDSVAIGDVLEILATDKGAPADFRSWCLQTDQKFLDVVQEDGYFRLLIKKVVAQTREMSRIFPHEIRNADLADMISAGTAPVVIDVREEHEYQAGHIPGAMHVPIDQIDQGIPDVTPTTPIAVVCRTGRRSDYACQILDKNGYAKVQNVVPGMSEWTGPTEK